MNKIKSLLKRLLFENKDKFSRGGIVPGPKPGDDRVPAYLFPDEADFTIPVDTLNALIKNRTNKSGWKTSPPEDIKIEYFENGKRKTVIIKDKRLKCEYCGSFDAELTIDPYNFDLYGDDEKIPLCDDCVKMRAQEI